MPDKKVIAKNKRASFDYEIKETFEAGIMLSGSEIKSVREGNVSLKGSFVTLQGETPMLTNAHISHYKPAADKQHEPTRSRKLLLKKSEIKKLINLLSGQGVSAMPLEMYIKGRWVKVLIGVGVGKKKYDKRQVIKDRDSKRRAERVVKGSHARVR